jgi:sortase (surface protein transpeptidase)
MREEEKKEEVIVQIEIPKIQIITPIVQEISLPPIQN